MIIKLSCPHCDQPIEAPGEVIGTVVLCPTCEKSFHVGRRVSKTDEPLQYSQKGIQPGYYFGTCTNTTVNLTASIAVLLQEVRNGHVSGVLGVYGDLCGGSAFSGTISGNEICLTTREPGEKLAIVWQGKFTGSSLSGTYRATAAGFLARITGLATQEGTWESQFASRSDEQPLTVNDSSRFRVRTDSRIEGPLPLQSFIDLLLHGHWPTTSHVSIDDRNQWIPIGLVHESVSLAMPPNADSSGFFAVVGSEAAKKVLSSLAASVVLGMFGIESD